MSENKQYVDRSFRQNRSKSNTKAQAFLYTLKSFKFRKGLLGFGIVFIVSLNAFTAYAAINWEVDERTANPQVVSKYRKGT